MIEIRNKTFPITVEYHYSPLFNTVQYLRIDYSTYNMDIHYLNNILMRKTLLSLLILLFVGPSFAQSAKEKADSLISAAIPNDEHGLSVLVAENGKVIYEKTAGYADIENRRKVTPTTTFRIGSVTKQFTAAGILKLAEMGKISIDDPLSKYIPEFPRGDEVTIHHLLTHTSGIKSYTEDPYFYMGVTSPIETSQLAKNIQTMGYDFDPGEKWKYNNSAYFILGYLIEKISGQSYEVFLKKHFFEPAGMKNTGVYSNQKTYKEEALGYSNQNDSIVLSLNWDMTWAGGAGNLYSTAHDLQKWNEAIFKGNLLKKESLQKALKPVKLNDGSEYPYGYGWGVTEYKGLKYFGHSGGLHGFLSNLAYYPEINATVVVLSNAGPPLRVIPGELSQKLTKIFFGEHLEEDTEVEVDKADYNLYVGEYTYPGGAILTVTKEGDSLFAQMTGQPKFEIFPKGEHLFFWKVVDAEIVFNVNDKDQVDFATHKQNGMEFKVEKK